jgi:hypothetical protein
MKDFYVVVKAFVREDRTVRLVPTADRIEQKNVNWHEIKNFRQSLTCVLVYSYFL